MDTHPAFPATFPLLFCATLLLVVGCGTLSSGSESGSGIRNDVESVRDEDRVSGCTFLTDVTATSSAFLGANDAENVLRGKATSAGGDVLLIKTLEGQTARGEVYDCATEGDDSSPESPDPPSGAPSPDAKSAPGLRVVADSSVRATVRAYVSTAWCGEGRAGEAIYHARRIYRYENCGEVEETLEITDVRRVAGPAQEDSLAAAFLRYSIGTKVFREVLWLRGIGERYALTDAHPPTAPEGGWSDEAAAVARNARDWQEASAVWYE